MGPMGRMTLFIQSFVLSLLFAQRLSAVNAAELPRSLDPRLTIELVAEQPEIVTPTGLAVDDRGRVFVAESHTHFPPENYDGPKADRILIFDDTNGDGRADKRTVFHEGFRHVMDIEFHRDGSLYVATRKDIHRLRDTDRDDRADAVTPLLRLETKGDYPHNGLSGIAFDFRGGFHFGLGENLGESYTLTGSDGAKISGGGEGGRTFHVDDDGKHLRRISTGWWNPYGMCTDSFGRVFGTDNDPDSSPPCRLIQVVDQGDYGYEFRYGRSGRNPLVTWDGELPGTLPMIAGTGEAPCHIVSYESDALPKEYYGNLVIPSWADHRVEYYSLAQRPDRGLVETKRQILIQGPDNFRPVGIDVAPDGTVYISDWVSSSYTLHKLGRIWRIRPQEMPTRAQADGPEQQLSSRDRRIRERAANALVKSAAGRATLEKQAKSAELPQVRATAMTALSRPDKSSGLPPVRSLWIEETAPLELRLLATQLGLSDEVWQNDKTPIAVRAAALQKLTWASPSQLTAVFQATDPLLQHCAIRILSKSLSQPDVDIATVSKDVPELPLLLAVRRSRPANPLQKDAALNRFLDSKDPAVRFCAVKWVADESLGKSRAKLERLLESSDLDLRTFLALSVAMQRLDGKPITDRPPPELLKAKIFDEKASIALRRWCLRLVEPNVAKIEFAALSKLLQSQDPAMRLEAVRTLACHADERRFEALRAVAQDAQQPVPLRAEAIVGLSLNADKYKDALITLANDSEPALRDEALRALVGVKLDETQRSAIAKLSSAGPSVAEAVARVIETKFPTRPAAQDTAAWSATIEPSGNATAGERVFFGTKVGRCSICHQVDGLGASVGPDLSQMSRRVAAAGSQGQQWLLETILQPSRDMAPQFTPWNIVTKDGKQYLGLPRRKGGKSEAYLGTDGREFTLKLDDIESSHEASVSIMPSDLLQQLTRQELADLFAFLTAKR